GRHLNRGFWPEIAARLGHEKRRRVNVFGLWGGQRAVPDAPGGLCSRCRGARMAARPIFLAANHRKPVMHHTTLGRTGLRVSVAGLGCGGFSKLGLNAGKSEDEAARLILEAVDLGINVIDTAAAYGTEGVVGRALKSIPRD